MTDILKVNLKEDIDSSGNFYDREETSIKFIHFNNEQFIIEACDDLNDIEIDPKDDINWIFITGLFDEKKILGLEETFNIHPLAIEDMLSNEERTKVESYDDFLFVVTDTVDYRKRGTKISELEFSQISFILKENVIITVSEKHTDKFNRLISRLKYYQATRFKSQDSMFFTLVNQIVDNYYDIFDKIGDDIDILEEEIMQDPDEHLLSDLYTIKKNLIYLRKTLWPLRNVVSEISNVHQSSDSKMSIYYRDAADHIVQMLEFIEVYRDMTSTLIDAVDTNIGNKTNDVMKVLTVWSTIFLPLTFITGVYGMNFNYMPELYQKWAYPLFWVVTFVIVIGMIIFFKKRDWI